MDEELDSLAQQYALRRNIKLGERLGFGIHGIVFAAEGNTKPSSAEGTARQERLMMHARLLQ